MKIQDLIEAAKKKAPSPMILDLIQEFEECALTMSQLPLMKQAGKEEYQAFLQKVNESHSRLRSYFMRIAASYGMTFEQFCEFLENSKNFAPTDWEEIQQAKQQLATSLRAPAKKKKLNKNVRI